MYNCRVTLIHYILNMFSTYINRFIYDYVYVMLLCFDYVQEFILY